MTTGADKLKTACITVLGSGFAPFASGTWGSAVAILLALPLWLLGSQGILSRVGFELGLVAGILVACVLSVAWGPWAVQRFGRKDPKQFVLDEFAGQWVSLLVLPATLNAGVGTWVWLVGGQFFLFRLFDVLKPPPARQMESLPDGWGILTDDLFAGLYANIVGQLAWRLLPLPLWLGIHLANTM